VSAGYCTLRSLVNIRGAQRSASLKAAISLNIDDEGSHDGGVAWSKFLEIDASPLEQQSFGFRNLNILIFNKSLEA
jgi:hypothetical protein